MKLGTPSVPNPLSEAGDEARMHFACREIKVSLRRAVASNSPPDCYIQIFEPQRLNQEKNGAGDEARTRYLHLGKVALYRMSYTRILAPKREPWCRPSEPKSFDSQLCEKWCLRSESNQRHVDFQSTALPTELQRHIVQSLRSAQMLYLATRNGLEPSTSSVTGWRANRLHHRARWWWEQQGSNL